MAAKIIVIDAKPVHSDVMADLHARSFSNGRGWTSEECAALLTDGRTLGALALKTGLFGKEAVGFVLAREAAGEAEILSIGVAPRARSKGVGRTLLAHVIGRLRMRSVESLFLEVEEGNAPALTLYGAFGFQTRGRRESYYHKENGRTSAALIMHLQI